MNPYPDEVTPMFRKIDDFLAAYESLTVEDEMYGQRWTRGFSLGALVNHEIHHRGQMTVLMRQAGQKVPGLMGPAKEEWSQFGMPEPPY